MPGKEYHLASALQAESGTCRIVLPRSNGAELLLVARGTHLALPSVEIPRWCRVAERISAAVKNRWGLEAYCLFTPEFATPSHGVPHLQYQVIESCRPNQAPPAGTYWVPLALLSENSLETPEDLPAIKESLQELEAYTKGWKPGPFGKTGWLRGLTDWIQEQIDPLGFRLTGRFRQLNASPTFSLICFETDGPPLWFKAVGEPNIREFPIAVELAQLFPGFVPRVVATRPEWNAWLSAEAEGVHLDERSDLAAWTTAAEALAQLQFASFGQALHLFDAGCKDARIVSLADRVDPFIEVMANLMDQQTKVSPAPLPRQELLALGDRIKRSLDAFEELTIPNALGHLDCNPGNILVAGNQCVFLDWAEACVGQPFVTFQYLLEHLRRLRPKETSWEAVLTGNYTRIWQCLVSPGDTARALALSPLVAAFAFAVLSIDWNDPATRQDSAKAAYLRSVTRRMQREAKRVEVAAESVVMPLALGEKCAGLP
jgi:hypothetical protein